METRYCDVFRPVDEDAYLRDFIRAVEHKDVTYIQFIVPIIKEEQRVVSSSVDSCGHYLKISAEDVAKYDQVLAHGLLLASHHGSLSITQYLLEQGANVNSQNQAGDTALIKACERGHEAIARVLIEAGADINQTNLVGSTALQWVARMPEKRPGIVKLLLSYDTIIIDQASHKRGRTALHCAVESDDSGEICKSLLDRGATVNIEDIEGITPLHLAAERGFLTNTRLLIEYGAHINMQKHKFGLTALHIAMREGHVDTAVLLLRSRADITIHDSFGQTALDMMRRYSKLAAGRYEYALLEDYIDKELSHVINSENERLRRVFTVLCELITAEDRWTALFEEFFQGRSVSVESSDDVLGESITCIPLRTSETSLSVLLLHLFHVWSDKYKHTATFWVLMRGLRDYGMSVLADRMIAQFLTESGSDLENESA